MMDHLTEFEHSSISCQKLERCPLCVAEQNKEITDLELLLQKQNEKISIKCFSDIEHEMEVQKIAAIKMTWEVFVFEPTPGAAIH
jgi:hypothetical protein